MSKNDATSQGTSLQSNQVSWCASYVSIIFLDIDLTVVGLPIYILSVCNLRMMEIN